MLRNWGGDEIFAILTHLDGAAPSCLLMFKGMHAHSAILERIGASDRMLKCPGSDGAADRAIALGVTSA
jgi:hypothetical protein